MRRLSKTYLLHDGQNPRLRIVVPVSTDAQIDLLVGGVFTIGFHQAKERVFGGRGDGGRGEDGRITVGTHDV